MKDTTQHELFSLRNFSPNYQHRLGSTPYNSACITVGDEAEGFGVSATALGEEGPIYLLEHRRQGKTFRLIQFQSTEVADKWIGNERKNWVVIRRVI